MNRKNKTENKYWSYAFLLFVFCCISLKIIFDNYFQKTTFTNVHHAIYSLLVIAFYIYVLKIKSEKETKYMSSWVVDVYFMTTMACSLANIFFGYTFGSYYENLVFYIINLLILPFMYLYDIKYKNIILDKKSKSLEICCVQDIHMLYFLFMVHVIGLNDNFLKNFLNLVMVVFFTMFFVFSFFAKLNEAETCEYDFLSKKEKIEEKENISSPFE